MPSFLTPASRVIDLTQTLCSENPSWDGDCGFKLSNSVDYSYSTVPDLFRVQSFTTRAGMGTHIDAPAHCFPRAKTIEGLALDNLITHCVVIRLDHLANENYIATPDVITTFERDNGIIQPNAFVIFCTGWNKYWNNPTKYRNDLQFPSIHEDTAKLLIDRHIAGLGTDTLSADAVGKSFPVHRAILGAGKYLVENIANADLLPPTGSQVFVLPTKIREGTEAPVRIIALA